MLRATKESETDESEKLVPYDDISSTVPSQLVDEDGSSDNERKRKKKKDKFSWKAITEKYNKLSKVDQDSIKTVVLLALVLMVMIRLATISQSQPADMQASALRSSKMHSSSDVYGGLGQPNMLQQQSTLAQNALLQQQQLAIVQAQQQQAQQQILLQAQAQKNAEEKLKQQQDALERQQSAILQQQQQQNHQTLLMQQTALIQQQQSSHMAMMQALGSQIGTGTAIGSSNGSSTANIGSSLPSSTDSSVGSSAGDSSFGSSAGDSSGASLAGDSSGASLAGDSSTGDASPETSDAAAGASGDIDLSALANFQDTWEPYDEKSIPIYWHIPKAGGSTVKDTIGACFRMVMATEFGVTDGHDTDTEIAVVYPKPPGGVTDDRSPFVNVDTTTPAGIERAAKMGFADSNLAGCVVTPFLYESNALFTPTAKGRLFAVFRHPIDRAVSMFYYIQVATWEPSYSPDLVNWTLKQYAESDKVENNWMVRQLSNQLSGEVDDSHLKIALEVVRSKFMVGLMKQVERSMARFERYFKWTYHVNPTNQEICRDRMTSGGSNSNSKNKKEKPTEGDEIWNLFAAQNNLDLQLYEYAEALFEEQEQFVEGVPYEFRKIDGTCCKCDPPTYPPEGFECPKKVDA